MDLSFRAYLTGLQFSSTSRDPRSWQFVVEVLGDERALESDCWAEFRARLRLNGADGADELARSLWKNYGAWRRRARQRIGAPLGKEG